SRRRHTRFSRDWSSDVCSSDLTFRPYAAGDRIGVELAGALKNVYALAAGAVDGARLGASARSALIARAFAELGRIIPALGGKARSEERRGGTEHESQVCQMPAI